MKRKLASAALAGAGVIGFTLIGSSPAQAAPGNCSTGWGGNTAYGNCTTGTGQFRIGIPCKNPVTAWHQYSAWRGVNVTAQVNCPFGSWLWTDIPGGAQILVEKRN
jgi:hypothetical protein